jgi:flagellar biosynthetic protein FliQ
MDTQNVIDLGFDALMVTLKIAAPVLLTIMLTGVVVSVLQAATQVSEQTLSFIPKILMMTVVLVISGPWILRTMMHFTSELFKSLGKLHH